MKKYTCFFFLFMCLTSQAFADSILTPSPEEKYRDAYAVFTGHEITNESCRPEEKEIQIDELFKGKLDSHLCIRVSPIEFGQTYLFYARKDVPKRERETLMVDPGYIRRTEISEPILEKWRERKEVLQSIGHAVKEASGAQKAALRKAQITLMEKYGHYQDIADISLEMLGSGWPDEAANTELRAYILQQEDKSRKEGRPSTGLNTYPKGLSEQAFTWVRTMVEKKEAAEILLMAYYKLGEIEKASALAWPLANLGYYSSDIQEAYSYVLFAQEDKEGITEDSALYLRNARFTNLDIHGVAIASTSSIDKFGLSLSNASGSRWMAEIKNSFFVRDDLRNTHFSYLIEDTQFNENNMENADFTKARLKGVIFNQNKMGHAALSHMLWLGGSWNGGKGRVLEKTDLSGAKLYSVQLIDLDFRDAKLDGIELNDSTYDCKTQWPEGFDPEKAGARPWGKKNIFGKVSC